tara:strand:- start:502 stop:705 length:204 start_codon:yes stop_codon:yes gene_type:complete
MIKKTKLTISGIAKKSIENIELAKTQSKNSVVIEKKIINFQVKIFSTKVRVLKGQKKALHFLQKTQM